MSIIIPQQDEIAVFVNESDSITISQDDPNGDDIMIYINAIHVTAVCKAMQACKKIIQSGNGMINHA